MTDCIIKQPNFGVLQNISSMVFPQNLPSIIVGYVLDPKPQDLILDMCASPGGKTTHIAQLSNNKSQIIAIDKTKSRTEKINKNIKRFGYTCITSHIFDSTKLYTNERKDKNKPPYLPETFDKILLDGPCSGIGQRPYLNQKFNCQKELDCFVIQQKKLFKQAIKLLKKDGILVYSTCTIVIEENENLVSWALDKFKNKIKLISHTPYISHYKVDSNLTQEQSDLIQRFDPILHYKKFNKNCVEKLKNDLPLVFDSTLVLDSIGFFIAKFKKL